MKRINVFFVAILMVLLAGCTRIETGEVGLRVNASKQIQGSELMEGSWNQSLVGDVLTFPIRDIALQVKDANPLDKDDTKVADLDFTVIYNLNPSSVSDLWSKKSKSFHTFDKEEGDWLLMKAFMTTVANNAAQKSIRAYPTLKLSDNREKIEDEIKQNIIEQLKKDGVENDLVITSVKVQSLLPNAVIVDSATANVKAQNMLNVAITNEKIAESEARRMAKLAEKGEASIAYMDAQSRQEIAKAIREGKVNTIVIPNDFRGIVNVK